MRLLFTILFFATVCTLQARGMFISQPQAVYTSQASIDSMVNTSLPASFLTCGSTWLTLISIKATAQSTGLIAKCVTSDAKGSCTASGNTSSTPALYLTTYQSETLGWDGFSYSPSEVSTGTKFHGDWIFQRRCVSNDFVR